MRPVLLTLAFLLATGAPAAEPLTTRCRFDPLGRFEVEQRLPAGTRHAVLETAADLRSPWRRMIGCTVDGRAATVTFRLPRQGARGFARVASGPETTLPPVELNDPELVTVRYGDEPTEQAKVAFLSEAGKKMREWQDLPRAQYHQRLIDWALGHPFVVRASIAPTAGNVSLLFSDGDVCVLLEPTRTADAPHQQTPPATGVPLPAEPGIGARTVAVGSLPGSNRAVTAFSLESTFPNSAPTVEGWLNGKGFHATHHPSPTVSQVQGWSSGGDPLGVLFWHAHGCSYLREDNSEGIGIVTREYTNLTDPVFGRMRAEGELMLAIDAKEYDPYYAITSKFIRRHLRFAPHSLVVLDACHGAHPDLAEAFLAAGAGSYASWDWLSGPQSGTPLLKVFDRLLGTNAEPPFSIPKERSFPLSAIQGWMGFLGYDEDPSPRYADQNRPNAKLVWRHHPTAPAHILRPSVMRVLAEAGDQAEPYSKFLIEGDFGPDPGAAQRSVLWGNRHLPVVRWDPLGGITVRVPDQPPSGDIQVILSKDYHAPSNRVPITEWTVPFTYEVTSHGSLGATMDLTVKFRGDIHGSRGMPEMEPQYLPVVFSNMADCTGTLTAAGTWQPNPDTTVTWSGGATLRSQDLAKGGIGVLDEHIWCNGILQVSQGSASMFSLTAGASFTETERVTLSNGGVRVTVREPTLGLDAFPFLLTGPLSFQPHTGRLAAGHRPIPGNPGTATLSWPAVTPLHAPTGETPR